MWRTHLSSISVVSGCVYVILQGACAQQVKMTSIVMYILRSCLTCQSELLYIARTEHVQSFGEQLICNLRRESATH